MNKDSVPAVMAAFVVPFSVRQHDVRLVIYREEASLLFPQGGTISEFVAISTCLILQLLLS